MALSDRTVLSRRGLAAALMLVLGIPLASLSLAASRSYFLPGPPSSNSGTHWIAFPYIITDPPINTCCDALGAIPNATGFWRFNNATDLFDACDCLLNDFAIAPGEGYQVQVSADSSFTIQGFDDAGVQINLSSLGASGVNMVALPFESASIDAGGLIDEINVDAGASAVNVVRRWVTTTDAAESYTGATGTNFPVVGGVGYQVQVSQDVTWTPSRIVNGSCSTPSLCNFSGFTNTALGQATLSVNAAGQLVVGNIGTSGNDGVEVQNNCPLGESGGGGGSRTGHNDWIDLGYASFGPIGKGGTPDGAFLHMTSFAEVTGVPGTQQFDVNFEKVAGSIEITSDFSAAAPTGLGYLVTDSVGAQFVSSGQSLSSVVVADLWPAVSAFSQVTFNTPTLVTIPNFPGPNIVVPNAVELWIIPENHAHDLASVERYQVTARSSPLETLTELIVIEEQIGAGCSTVGGPAPLTRLPGVSRTSVAVAAALMLILIAWLARRRP